MSPDMAALLAKPQLPLALLLLGVGVGMAIGHVLTQLSRGTLGRTGRPRWPWKVQTKKTPWEARSVPAPARPLDTADQLRVVMGARFTMQPLLNKSEARVLRELERFVEDRNPSWQVMAQVSVGEIVRSADATAFSCINSKRIDLLLIDGDCLDAALWLKEEKVRYFLSTSFSFLWL